MTDPNNNPRAEAAKQQAKKDVSAASAANAQRPARATCTVGLKHPNGLVLQLYRVETHPEPVFGGGTRMVERRVPAGDRVTLHGSAVAIGKSPRCIVANGYALTSNVSLEFMREWMKQNEKHDLVVNRLIFVQDDENEARAEAADHGKTKSGLEPLNPNLKEERRVPRPANPQLAALTRDDSSPRDRATAA